MHSPCGFTSIITVDLITSMAAPGLTLRDQYSYQAKPALPPIWVATWIARVLVVTAPERLFGSRPGENKPWLVRPACAWPAVPASPLPGAFTPPPRSPTANDHEVLNGFGRRPASCPAMLPAATAG
jgi:hypothetical protein